MDHRAKIRKNRVLAALIDDDFSRLSPFMVHQYLEQEAVIQEVGARVEFVYFSQGAVFSSVTMMGDGQGAESGTVGFESATGILHALGDMLSFTRTLVQIPEDCVTLPSAQVRAAAAASPALTSLLVAHAQINYALTKQSVACNALHHIDARLCRWLLLSADRSGSDDLPLTQDFLGLMLGVQRTTVTLIARRLASSGLIRYRRGLIELIDRKGLEGAACECYQTVKREQERLLADHPPLR